MTIKQLLQQRAERYNIVKGIVKITLAHMQEYSFAVKCIQSNTGRLTQC